jgi:hypothetical protein
MKKLTFLLLLGLLACDKAKESAQDTLTNALEKAVESQTGTQIDLPDAAEMADNAGLVSYETVDKVYLKDDKMTQATLIINKEKKADKLLISLQLVGETGKSFTLSLGNVPENFSLPLKGKFAVSNAYDGVNPTASVMFLDINEGGMQATAMPYEGELTITKLSKTSVEFELEGKGGDATDVESPSNWKAISGKGKLVNPIIMSYGIDKNDVLK